MALDTEVISHSIKTLNIVFMMLFNIEAVMFIYWLVCLQEVECGRRRRDAETRDEVRVLKRCDFFNKTVS